MKCLLFSSHFLLHKYFCYQLLHGCFFLFFLEHTLKKTKTQKLKKKKKHSETITITDEENKIEGAGELVNIRQHNKTGFTEKQKRDVRRQKQKRDVVYVSFFVSVSLVLICWLMKGISRFYHTRNVSLRSIL